jgi:hypothetical protein
MEFNNSNNENQPKPADSDKKPMPEAQSPGLNVMADAGLSKPPLEGVPEPPAATAPADVAAGQPEAEVPKGSKEPIAITVDFVEITLGSMGTLAFQFTGYSPFQFSQKELQTIANLFAACEIKAPAQIQLIIGLVALMGAKIGGFVMWRRAGKPPIRFDADGNMIVGDASGASPAGVKA